jgi:hypothetical protein
MLTSGHGRLYDTVTIASGNVVATEYDGEIILLSIEQGRCYGLNRIGSLIWRTCAVPMSVTALVEAFQKAFAEDAAFTSQDITDFIGHLVAEKLMESAAMSEDTRQADHVNIEPDLIWERPLLIPFDLADAANGSLHSPRADGVTMSS